MKRAIGLAVSFAFLLVIAAPVFALPVPIEKFRGGIEKIVKSPLDIPHYTIDEVKSSTFKPFGLVGGLVKGTYHMVKKVVDGTLDVATFPLDIKD